MGMTYVLLRRFGDYLESPTLQILGTFEILDKLDVMAQAQLETNDSHDLFYVEVRDGPAILHKLAYQRAVAWEDA